VSVARHYTSEEVLNLIVRKRWLILIPIAIGLAAAPLLEPLVPPRFRSEALLLVVPQQVPRNYVQPTVTESVADRLPSITAQILSRSKLERIILDMDLYKAERSREVMEDVVETMRTRDVKTSAVGKDVDSFRVGFMSDDADTARRVTERLASLYIEQNVQDRTTQADISSQFLATELDSTKRRLVEQEKKLEAYRKSHSGQLPSQLQGNLAAIESVNRQLQAIHQSVDRGEENRLRIERQLADLQAPLLFGSSTTAGPSSLSTAETLEAEQKNLEELLQGKLPTHPAVRTAQRTVAELTARLGRETAAAKTTAENTAEEKPLTAAAAAQERRIRDLKADLQLIDRQMAQMRKDEEGLKKVLGSYQANVDSLPTRESELVELTRDYNTLLNYYNSLVMKREDAGVAATLERKKIGEQFSLLDQASRPEKPSNNFQRLAMTASGAVAGLVLSLLAIGWREYSDPSFRSKEEVVKAIALPVLASIPVMKSAREQQLAVRRMRMLDIGGSVLLLASVAIVVAWRLY
jgi:polysaccharide chain length determinant protein (PEP-CTERM system associated)